MTASDDDPYAPPAYPPPTGSAFRPSAGDVWVPDHSGVDPHDNVTQPIAGLVTEPVKAPPTPMNRHAKRALLLGVLALPLTPIAGIAAMAVGRRARSEIARTGEKGGGLALTGAWMGGVFSLLWLCAAAFVISVQVGSIAV